MRTLMVVLALISVGAQAQVYKCKDEATGKVTFSDVGCGGNNSEKLRVPATAQDSAAARRQAIEAKQAEESTGPRVSAVGDDGDKANSSECQKAKRSYEVESGSAAHNQKLIFAKRSQMYIACGIPEPATNIIVKTEPTVSWYPGNRHTVTHCQADQCWDAEGFLYRATGKVDQYFAPDGSSCRLQGSEMRCP